MPVRTSVPRKVQAAVILCETEGVVEKGGLALSSVVSGPAFAGQAFVPGIHVLMAR